MSSAPPIDPIPAQEEPNRTLLPPPRAPLTVGNVWAALKMVKPEDLSPSRLAEIPCMKQSLLQGMYGGTGFAALRLISGKPVVLRNLLSGGDTSTGHIGLTSVTFGAGVVKGLATAKSAMGWFFFGFLVVGGAANTYCMQKRNEEIEMMRLVQQRYPDRNIVTAGRRAKAAFEAEQAEQRTTGLTSTAAAAAGKVWGEGEGQKVNMKEPPKVEVSQPKFVEVRDAQGEVVGRMSPAMAELARSRGANETFSSPAPTLPPSPTPSTTARSGGGVFEAISER